MKRACVAMTVVATLACALPGWASAPTTPAPAAPASVSVTGAVGTANISYYLFSSNGSSEYPYCGDEYDGTTLTLVLRSQGRQWKGVLRSGPATGSLDDPSNPRFVRCKSANFPGQYFRGTADSDSPTQGNASASCGGHFDVLLWLYCSFTVNGTPSLNATLHLAPYDTSCNGQLLPYEYCEDQYLIENLTASSN